MLGKTGGSDRAISAECMASKKLAREFSLSCWCSPVKSKMLESRRSGLGLALVSSEDLWLLLCQEVIRRGGTSSVRGAFRRGEIRLGGGGRGRPSAGVGGGEPAWSDQDPEPRDDLSSRSEMISCRSSGTSVSGCSSSD